MDSTYHVFPQLSFSLLLTTWKLWGQGDIQALLPEGSPLVPDDSFLSLGAPHLCRDVTRM